MGRTCVLVSVHSPPRSGLSPPLLEQADAGDGHGAIERFAHVIKGEQRDTGGRHRFHFDTCLTNQCGTGGHTYGVRFAGELDRDAFETLARLDVFQSLFS